MPKFMSSKRARLAAAGVAGVVIATTATSAAVAMTATADAAAGVAADAVGGTPEAGQQGHEAHKQGREAHKQGHEAHKLGQDAHRQQARQVTERHQEARTPKQVAHGMLGKYGWSDTEFGCLDSLWTKESNWEPGAANPSSGAFGIPQSLPGSQMASAGSDWQTNPATQIKWGLTYIQGRYGSPCGAWAHETSAGWY